MSRPLANKLYIREGYRIAILNPPVGYSQLLGEPPDNVTVANSVEGEFDVIQFFVTNRKKSDREGKTRVYFPRFLQYKAS